MIGIAAVILTVGLGQGAEDQVRSTISSLGTNLLTVTPGSTAPLGSVTIPVIWLWAEAAPRHEGGQDRYTGRDAEPARKSR